MPVWMVVEGSLKMNCAMRETNTVSFFFVFRKYADAIVSRDRLIACAAGIVVLMRVRRGVS